jgi:hypothetical protein
MRPGHIGESSNCVLTIKSAENSGLLCFLHRRTIRLVRRRQGARVETGPWLVLQGPVWPESHLTNYAVMLTPPLVAGEGPPWADGLV